MLTEYFYETYIKDTEHKALVVVERGLLCGLREEIRILIGQKKPCDGSTIFLNTIALKHIFDRHIYDKHTPDDYENLPYQRAHFLLVKKIDERLFLCGIEIMGDRGLEIEVVSAFVTKEPYLEKFTRLWSRRDG